MRKFISTLLIIAILVGGFFLLGGDVSVDDNGMPSISFNVNWKQAGTKIGNAVTDLVEGVIAALKKSSIVEDILPTIPNDIFGTEPEETEGTEPNVPDVPEGSSLAVHFIDVGQADAILIRCDGKSFLIDGGNNDDGDLLVSYIQNLGIKTLDLVVGTHAHEDHIGGLDTVLAAFPVGQVWYPEYRHGTSTEKAFLKAVTNQQLTPIQPTPGTTYNLGSAVCQVLGPSSLDPEEPNNHSIVIKVTYGETKFLFTGDMEFLAESQILDAGYDVSCDVLKVAHHGSNSSTKYRWLREADPTYAVISVGAGNEYGHPTDACLSILEDAEVTVYRTDLHGHVVCTSDGKNLSFTTEKGN